MAFSLEIVAGYCAGARCALTSGQTMIVGRSLKASLCFPEDTFLSGTHFSLEVAEDDVLLRDLKSTNGTFVNGQRVIETTVKPGDTIGAGSLEFRLSLQAHVRPEAATTALPILESPGPASPTFEPPDSPPILRFLQTMGSPVYCLLDSACDQKIGTMIANAKERVHCLYDGQSAIELAPWAPYLAELPVKSELAAALFTEGWGKGWASYFVSRYPFEDLRHHFRKFLMVKMDDGTEAYFRFYDPRVLREFLPTSTRTEVWEFFGPVEKWAIEAKDPELVLILSHEYGTLKCVEVRVSSLT